MLNIYKKLKFIPENGSTMLFQTLKMIGLLFVALLLFACQSKPTIPYYEPDYDQLAKHDKNKAKENKARQIDLKNVPDQGELLFRIQDRLKLSVWGYPELDHVAEIQANGNITLPLVGEIRAEKQTPATIRQAVKKRLTELARPQNGRLRYGDIVQLYVWQHPELNFKTQIQPNGEVTLPLVGTLNMLNRPIDQINISINRALSKHIKNPKAWIIPEVQTRRVINDPIVSILPIKLNQQKATVIGEVLVQGQQNIDGSMRVMDLLANAKIKDEGELDSVVIIRDANSDEPQYSKLRLQAFLEGEAPRHNLVVQEGDIIIVPKTNIAALGYFIDSFFTKTKPIFDWYLTAANAVHYNSIRKLVESLNRAAKEAFEDSSVEPSIP